MWQLALELRRQRAATWREDEGERRVVADLLRNLERLLEVGVGLAREADDDVRRERAVGYVLTDERHAVHVALAVVRTPHRLEDAARAPPGREGGVVAHRRELRGGAENGPPPVPSGRGPVAGAGRGRE